MKLFTTTTTTDDDGRTDGRRLDGYTISSPCEPNGSGELIRNYLVSLNRYNQAGIGDTVASIYGSKQISDYSRLSKP